MKNWRRIFYNKLICLGGGILLAVVLLAVFAELLTSYDPSAQDLTHSLKAPGRDGHPLGTDDYGRDLWSRIVFGARISVRVACVSLSISFLAGCFLGLVSGYFGGAWDMLLGRVIDVMMSFPPLLLALLIVAMIGASLTNATIAIGITLIPRFYRVIRSSTLVVRERNFVLASKAMRRSCVGIILRHILPNVLSPIIVVTSLATGTAIMTEAELSFLGLGVPPPTPSWGQIVSAGRYYITSAPWVSTFSGLMVAITVLGANIFGDGLRDYLDPKFKG